jgi:outer membrane protein OmpA-like peptidoglycan-associated protein
VLQALDGALATLPADIARNTPLVLVGGASESIVSRALAKELVRITDTAIWVRVAEPARLMYLADALKRWRDGQGPDAFAYLLDANDAADAADAATLAANIRQWRAAIGEAGRAIAYPLPVCIGVYENEANPTADDCPWFGISGARKLEINAVPAVIASQLTQYVRMAVPVDRELRAYRAARLDALARWAGTAVLPYFTRVQNAARPVEIAAFGVTALEGAVMPDTLLARFIAETTGLGRPAASNPASATPGRAPLPDPLIRGIAPQPVRRTLPRALAHGFVWLAAFFCAACAASAWQNQKLVGRIRAHMSDYRAIQPAHDAARLDALTIVKRDRDEIDRYARIGVPPRLGLGFYRGAALLPVANALIASYEPPPPDPSTIELSSLSLFQSGRAVLSAGSNRVLVGALDMIKAHPDKRVLIAGHTDSSGSRASNLALSEARAASVRDWLADASGIPPSHFAIQGYGDTRPKAGNDTEASRALNRRVEITLVPDCRDDQQDSVTPKGHTACSFN